MFALGIPNRQYRRTTQVLGHESSEPIPYEVEKQEDGFYLFMFPECDEYDFREIVRLLKVNGITTIGADSQLTEKNIMKLTDLIKEMSEDAAMKKSALGMAMYGRKSKMKEQGFDDRLKAAMGDDDFEKATSKDIEIKGRKGFEAARKLIAKLREKTYRSFSDEDLDAFSKEMVLHLIDNPAAEAAIKMRSAKSKSDEYKPGTTDDLPF